MRRSLFWLLIIALVPGPAAHATWREASSDHFIIYSEQNAKELLEFATGLERFDKSLRVLSSSPDWTPSPANRLTIFVVSRIGTVQKLLHARQSSIAGFYIGRASGSIAIVPQSTGGAEASGFDSYLVLQHEYAHHFMAQNFEDSYPAWFVEGFAEVASTSERQKDGSLKFGLPASHRAYGLIVAAPVPIEKLLSQSTLLFQDGSMSEAYYGRGWLLTHYLSFEGSRKGQLNDYLGRLTKGEDTLEAAKAAFGDLKQLNKDLNAYLRRRTMKYLNFPASMLPIGHVTVKEVDTGADAIMDLRIQSRVGVTKEEAPAIALKERKIAVAFPDSAAVQIALAEAELDARNLIEAAKAADRAVALDPKSGDALIFKGRVKMESAIAAKATDSATWSDIRKSFVAANHIEPDDPEPLMLFYQSFQAQGKTPSANAVSGLMQALAMAPQDMQLRITAGYQLLVDGKVKEARQTLVPVAFDPHGGKVAEDARAVVIAMDKTGRDEALRLWNKLESEPEANDAPDRQPNHQ